MKTYQPEDFTNNPGKIRAMVTNKENTIIAKQTLFVIYPKRFNSINLAISAKITTLPAIFIISDANDNYNLVSIPIMVDVEPSTLEEISIGDVKYIKLTIPPGGIVINKLVMVDNGLTFAVIDEFIIKGKVPFYLGYSELLDLFISDVGSSGIGDNPLVIEAPVSVMARQADDIDSFYRTRKTDVGVPIKYVGFSDTVDGLSTNIARLTGAYLNDGITVVLTKEDPPEADIEKYLKR